EQHALVRELLDAVEQRLALAAIELARLLLEQVVDVGMAAGRVRPAGDEVVLDARGGVAVAARAAEQEVLQLLVLPRGEIRGPLDRAEARTDADRRKVVEDGLGGVRELHGTGQLAGIEAVRIPGLTQELL